MVLAKALLQEVERGLVAASRNQNADANRGILAGVDGLLTRAVGLVTHLHALHGVFAGCEPGDRSALALIQHADGLAVHENFHTVQVAFDHHAAEFRRGTGGGLRTGRHPS